MMRTDEVGSALNDEVRRWAEQVRAHVSRTGAAGLRRESDGAVVNAADGTSVAVVRSWLYHDVHLTGNAPETTTADERVLGRLVAAVDGSYPSTGWHPIGPPQGGNRQIRRHGVRLLVPVSSATPGPEPGTLTVALPRSQRAPLVGWFGVVSAWGAPARLENRIYLHLADVGDGCAEVLEALDALREVRWRAKFCTSTGAGDRPDNVVIYLAAARRADVLAALMRARPALADPVPGFAFRCGTGIASAHGALAGGEHSFGVEVAHLFATFLVEAGREGRPVRAERLVEQLRPHVLEEPA
ncbi:hypothetical protein GCM10027271_26950 [Saccharopolyspora gloriosae]